jgi:putative alpha-1,2-mannosidase
MRELYRNAPDGLCGNEDCGQMSAWYVMSALGFYPVNPCGGEYELGAPLFPEATLHLENGKTFTVVCHFSGYNCHSERSEESKKDEKDSSVATLHRDDRTVKYHKSLKPHLNGKRLKGTVITHEDIMNGGMLEF